ncbi:rRNA-processing protein EFG1 [Citrus sinensis]|uniref:rRNA-processing protein EFG1 n=1 Tax=Citrus sinensis TaxID=2711 RepID=A0ACB8I5V0_CITSI|nr:rRNA-processing protein EFG1 [Citrus sinensis]KAH9764658.1 rRNA-processing protein EFG1 [Citrus sinensis]
MAHGGYGKRRLAERKPVGRRSKGLAVEKKPKPKSVSLKNQIRSVERMLRKELPAEVREAQQKKLEELKKQQEIHTRLAVERKIFLRDRKIKFFERRKIERRIRRLEKLQRTSSGQAQDAEQLSKLKEDLEYVRAIQQCHFPHLYFDEMLLLAPELNVLYLKLQFFPKTEKYVSLFTGGDDSDIVDRRNRLRKQIKANLIAAAASGKDLEETGSEDDGLLDLSDDDFFLTGSSSDEADADDEWTDKSTREQASSASGKAASGMSSDERNQRQNSARALMPPPRPSTNTFPSSVQSQSRFGSSSRKNSSIQRAEMSTSSNTSNSRSESSFRARGSSNTITGHSSNLSSNSDAHKPRRKRRPKKKKQKMYTIFLCVILSARLTHVEHMHELTADNIPS